jgi:hypothetical protein
VPRLKALKKDLKGGGFASETVAFWRGNTEIGVENSEDGLDATASCKAGLF